MSMKKVILNFVIIFLGTFSGFLSNGYINTRLLASTFFQPQIRQVSVHKTAPVLISIPKLGINSRVEVVGKDDEGKMDVPKNTDNVAWYKLGPTPGEKGSAVIDGHYDSKVGPAVFYNLSALEKGDTIVVKNASGKQVTFVVEGKEVYPYNAIPVHKVFAQSDKPRLNLVTCEGIFDHTTHNYSDRLVVYTTLL
jgi:LPXTG-site transpeptidase (sortase) family protein